MILKSIEVHQGLFVMRTVVCLTYKQLQILKILPGNNTELIHVFPFNSISSLPLAFCKLLLQFGLLTL